MRAFSKCPNCGQVPIVSVKNKKNYTGITVECECFKLSEHYYEKAVIEWYHHIIIANAKKASG